MTLLLLQEHALYSAKEWTSMHHSTCPELIQHFAIGHSESALLSLNKIVFDYFDCINSVTIALPKRVDSMHRPF